MIRQEIDIDGHWLVTVIYLPQPDELWKVAEAYERLGCLDDEVETIISLMLQRNKGATFTNFRMRRSVVTIGRATSWEQFFDSVLHETKHLVDDIVAGYDIMNYGEPPAYLQGYIGRQMAPVIKRLACPCCGVIDS